MFSLLASLVGQLRNVFADRRDLIFWRTPPCGDSSPPTSVKGNLLSGVHEPDNWVIAEVVLLDAHVEDGKVTPYRAKVNSPANTPRASL